MKVNLKVELKGGTSLSKGFHLIDRFSEDIDVRIEPDEGMVGFKVYTGKNHDKKPKHIESRKKYFDWLAEYLSSKIPGAIDILRDPDFDDEAKYRNGAIRVFYDNVFTPIVGVKQGILLEVGFDNTTPNFKRDISSWAFDHAYEALGKEILDNRAYGVPCYDPRYTFVEELQAVVRKYRLYKSNSGLMPKNFLRHYYDIYCLLEEQEVRNFIGTPEYEEYKALRFGGDDTKVSNSDAFRLSATQDRNNFEKALAQTSALYYSGCPSLEEILNRIQNFLPSL